jgi:hypothetical protein
MDEEIPLQAIKEAIIAVSFELILDSLLGQSRIRPIGYVLWCRHIIQLTINFVRSH